METLYKFGQTAKEEEEEKEESGGMERLFSFKQAEPVEPVGGGGGWQVEEPKHTGLVGPWSRS